MRPWLFLLLAVGCGFAPGELPFAEPPVAGGPPEVAHDVARPTDPPPDLPSTPSGSIAARPHWGPQETYAPMLAHDESVALFERAAAGPGERLQLEGATLACRLEVTFAERPSTASPHDRAAELDLAFGFGANVAATDPHAARGIGSQASRTAFFVVPSVHLREGDAIDVLVNDRDRPLHRDYIDRLGAAYTGTVPLLMTGEHTHLECRELGDALLAEVVRDRLWSVDDALAEWTRAEIEGSPTAAMHGLAGVAALVGWDDPRVVRRIRRGTEIERALRRRGAQEIAGARARLGKAAAIAVGRRRMEFVVDDVRCRDAVLGADRRALVGNETCMIDVTIDGLPSAAAEGASALAAWRWRVLDASARPMTVRVLDQPASPAPQAAGELRRVQLAVRRAVGRAEFTPDDDPWAITDEPAILILEGVAGPRRAIRLALGEVAAADRVAALSPGR